MQNSVYFHAKNTFFQNNQLALANNNFADQKIMELMNTWIVKEVENVPYIVTPLSVSQISDKLRQISDLRLINMHFYKDKLKFEG